MTVLVFLVRAYIYTSQEFVSTLKLIFHKLNNYKNTLPHWILAFLTIPSTQTKLIIPFTKAMKFVEDGLRGSQCILNYQTELMKLLKSPTQRT